jgi:8-oxo-dGTP diphosphatase
MNYTHCPYCGTRYLEQAVPYVHHCIACDKTVYLHSAPTVSAVIVDGDRVLLGKRGVPPFKGLWDIIGGFVEYGEHPDVALQREVMEETGMTVAIVDCLGFFMDVYGENGTSTLNIAFTAKIVSGEPVAADDVAALQWFEKTALPMDSMAFQNGKDMLQAWLLK